MAIKFLILLFLLAAALFAQDDRRAHITEEVTIENLTAKESADLEAARKIYNEALKKLDAVETSIRQSHGESANGYPGDAVFHCRWTTVELRGQFAIVSKTPLSDACSDSTFTGDTLRLVPSK